jgi:hypothetical protein
MKRRPILVPALTLAAAVALAATTATTASAEAPSRPRTLTCSDGTTFLGEQVRFGLGQAPATWRNVVQGAEPAAFNFHANTITAPDGTVVERLTWDNTQGVQRNQTLVTCSFIIPIGPYTGYTADFTGFFVPTGR